MYKKEEIFLANKKLLRVIGLERINIFSLLLALIIPIIAP
jgi:hypothetical protein